MFDRSAFLKTYIKLRMLKLMKSIPLTNWFIVSSVNAQIKVATIAIIISLIVVFAISAFTGWYTKESNLDGIWTAVHGVLFDTFFVAIFFNWYSRKSEDLKLKPVKALVYAKIHRASTNCISVFVEDYICSEKQYIYFNSNLVITHKYRYLDYFGTDNKKLEQLKFNIINAIINFSDIKKSYIDCVTRFCDEVELLAPFFPLLLEVKAFENVIKSQEASKLLIKNIMLEDVSSNDEIDYQLKTIISYISSLLYYLFTLVEHLESAADKVESRDEHYEHQQNEIKTLKAIHENIKSC